MKLVNTTNADSPFYVGKCKNNTPPKHVTAEGEAAAQKKDITIDGVAAVMYKSAKSADYIYILKGEEWLWIKDATAFDQTTFTEVPKAEKPVKEKKEKSEGGAKTTAPEITLDPEKTYICAGAPMTGATAYKRLGKKNTKDLIAQGKVFETNEDGTAFEHPLGYVAPAEEAAAEETSADAETA